MVFAKQLRERIRRGRIRSTVRIWQAPHVKVGGRYPMDDGHVVVDSIDRIRIKDLVEIARHGSGRNVYLIRFHYLPPGGWDISST